MNNRVPIYVLGVLVLVAIIWRMAHPPVPPPPGPLGVMPTWDSMTRIGDMGPCAVNPAGSMWAGAWNEIKPGKLRSAVWVLDLENQKSWHCALEGGSIITSLGWKDDGTVWALAVDGDEPAEAADSRLIICKAGSGSGELEEVTLKSKVARILAWPAGSGKLVAQLAGGRDSAVLAVLSEDGEVSGNEIELGLPKETRFYHTAALSPDGTVFVFGVEEDEVGGNETFYLADIGTGSSQRVFGSADLPGKIEGVWVAPKGVLLAVSEREKFHVLAYDPAAGKLDELGKPGVKVDVAGTWPDAPKTMKFITYNGGYELSLATAKVKRLFDLSKLSKSTSYWREQVQDGRLYLRKDGTYTSTSLSAGTVDIRVIKKNGLNGPELLPRR